MRIPSLTSLVTEISNLNLSSTRGLSSSAVRHAAPTLHPTTSAAQKPTGNDTGFMNPHTSVSGLVAKPDQLKQTPAQRATTAARMAREKLKLQEQQAMGSQKFGGLAKNSLFADEDYIQEDKTTTKELELKTTDALSKRNPVNMAVALNPRPNARARWQRKMVIKHVHRRGRLTKELILARTERSHLTRSHFFKTSMKKLAPLARQIAGKSIDEAILQMRFSKKKVAQDVREHLIQARNEAIVMKGMGLRPELEAEASTVTKDNDHVDMDPGITPPLPHQNPTKSVKDGYKAHETDMYIAEAWVNRGPYGREPEFRARGRVNILRPPHTGISVLLKEEKTRTRQSKEKEEKVIRKRLGKNMWTQLPDRKITNQSQYVLW